MFPLYHPTIGDVSSGIPLPPRLNSPRLRPRFAWLRSGDVASTPSTLTLQPYGLPATTLYTTQVPRIVMCMMGEGGGGGGGEGRGGSLFFANLPRMAQPLAMVFLTSAWRVGRPWE